MSKRSRSPDDSVPRGLDRPRKQLQVDQRRTTDDDGGGANDTYPPPSYPSLSPQQQSSGHPHPSQADWVADPAVTSRESSSSSGGPSWRQSQSQSQSQSSTGSGLVMNVEGGLGSNPRQSNDDDEEEVRETSGASSVFRHPSSAVDFGSASQGVDEQRYWGWSEDGRSGAGGGGSGVGMERIDSGGYGGERLQGKVKVGGLGGHMGAPASSGQRPHHLHDDSGRPSIAHASSSRTSGVEGHIPQEGLPPISRGFDGLGSSSEMTSNTPLNRNFTPTHPHPFPPPQKIVIIPPPNSNNTCVENMTYTHSQQPGLSYYGPMPTMMHGTPTPQEEQLLNVSELPRSDLYSVTEVGGTTHDRTTGQQGTGAGHTTKMDIRPISFYSDSDQEQDPRGGSGSALGSGSGSGSGSPSEDVLRNSGSLGSLGSSVGGVSQRSQHSQDSSGYGSSVGSARWVSDSANAYGRPSSNDSTSSRSAQTSLSNSLTSTSSSSSSSWSNPHHYPSRQRQGSRLKVHTEAEEPEHEQEHGREHGGGDSRFPSIPDTRRGEDWGWSLGDFELLETLGTGTFGRVILCRIRPGSRPHRESMASMPDYCAMKVLQKSEVVRLKQVEHIGCERSILGAVAHPFIVNLICTFQDEKNIYMLLEFVQGGELFSHLRRAGRFTADITRFYAANILLAIEYLHSHHVIYRDLKPENLLLDGRGYIKITDFGFAKRVPDRTFTLCGTPEYLSPEIIQSTGHGKAADWWAFGVLLFEMLCGYPPFYDDNPFGIYEKILAGRFAFPPHVDYVARDLIRRLLTSDRTKRLGNLQGGAGDVKDHRWFEGVDWDSVLRKDIGAPIIPHTSFAGDTSHFEKYTPAALEDFPGMMRARQQHLGIGDLTDPNHKPHDPYEGLFKEF